MPGCESFEQIKSRNPERGDYEASYSRAAFEAVVEREGEATGYEARWHRRDGTEIYVRENVQVIRDKVLTSESPAGDDPDVRQHREAGRGNFPQSTR